MLELDELVEEVLLRIPPDDPASLLRAALVCRRWRRLVSGPAFRRRFLELRHHTPPMLGFFVGNNFILSIADFVPTSSIPRQQADSAHGCGEWRARARLGGGVHALPVVEGAFNFGLADGVGLWAQSRAIELEMLLPADAISNSIDAIIGSANGAGVIFLRTHVGIFAFDLRSSQVKKVSEARHYGSVLPYVSFYYTPPPALE
ncbi:unnamed protein product [Urochloa decumbens]|uniref:F-box domain-containing protein n=1 Tax=Urochloa decumbens TaxID=240449 RepID=A0ABC9D926_9POAL